jgi:hypothetical protein
MSVGLMFGYRTGAVSTEHSMMLATLPADVCPDCGDPLAVEILEQPALFIACGYGATMRTIHVWCPCGWTLQRERTEVWP